MSTEQTTPPPEAATEQMIEAAKTGKPIPFKPKVFLESSAPDVASPPHTRAECEANGGHGGADGTNVYSTPKLDPKTGLFVQGSLICGLCGETNIA